jgi:hypothetical protein
MGIACSTKEEKWNAYVMLWGSSKEWIELAQDRD